MTASCGSCRADIRDGYLCRTCTRELREALTDLAPGRSLLPGHAIGPVGRGTSTRWDTVSAAVVGGLAQHLDTTVARQAVIGTRGKRGKGESYPTIFHEKAADVRARLVTVLTPWATELLEMERPTAQPPRCPHRSWVGVDCPCVIASTRAHRARRAQWADRSAAVARGDVAASATYLLTRFTLLTGRDTVGQLHRDLRAALRRLENVIDRDPDRISVGTCGADLPNGATCTKGLYADPAEAFVICPACRHQWSVDDRRAQLLKDADDSLGNAATIATALTRLEQPVTADRIYKWKERGRLKVHGHEPPPPCREHQGKGRQPAACQDCRDRTGAPLYRLGDVVDLLTEAAQAETTRAAKRQQKAQAS